MSFDPAASADLDPRGRVRVGETGRVNEDLPCVVCGYNLYSSPADGVCPECGGDVELSVYGNYLRFCNPKWLRGLFAGMIWLLVAMLLVFVMLALIIALPLMYDWSEELVVAVTGVCISLPWLVGVWLLTQRESDGGELDEYAAVRRAIARYGTIAGAAVTTVHDFAQTSTLLAQPVVLVGLSLVSGILSIVGSTWLMLHLRTLALRVPSNHLALQTIVVLVLTLIVLVLVVVAEALAHAGVVGVGANMAVDIFFGCSMVLIGLICLVWWLVLAGWYVSVFYSAGEIAKRRWTADTVGTQ